MTQKIQNEQAAKCANSSNYPRTASDRLLIERLSGSPYYRDKLELAAELIHNLCCHSEISSMSTVQIEIPEEVLISLKETPETISRELRILAAVKLFELGKLSSGRAAQLAGISRVEFLMLLGRYQVSPFSLTTEQLERDVHNA